ncbi:MAG: DUF503 domain-containing protein [Deltaproteobacteria bacterium]|nr:DUF503 domain-containing protein [Deltaproteobacteria bacterium]
MVIGTGIIDLLIAESRSLKEKRGVLNRIIKRTQSEFNISIAEIGVNDHWKRAKVGFCVVGNESRYINGKIDRVIRFIDNLQLVEILHTKIEIIQFPDSVDHFDYEEDKYREL